ncbi:RBBP8 N-terminal-like protein [Sorex araneus]|uniref:RBBP8 N-terminal-like protein n=1 Tax=Sorex araneus TaxID=42254 RepID=UPI002433D5C2|nr:RBBP8 N-terminal-like protein [Sorex araneus]
MAKASRLQGMLSSCGRLGPRAAMESFIESLNRLRDIHETEVLGLQSKLLELNAERCRDAQRAEELSAKNQQLREQQRALKENVRALENRLRAGLCDRCVVTQELARKKQREFEGSLLQSLQHVFILTNEMSRLQEENNGLKKEVKRLRGPGDRPRPPSREGTSSPPSPPSPSTWKTGAETPARGPAETQDEHPEKPVGYRVSPGSRTSPGGSGPEPPRPSDMSPQRISNQLHGTIAVVRPGSWAPRPACSGPPSPPADSLLQPPAGAYASLTCPRRAGQLCLLDPHLALRLQSPPGGPRALGLKAGAEEAWEEGPGSPASPQLEGALQLLLARQLRARGLVGATRPRRPPTPAPTPPSPAAGSDSEGPEGEGQTPRAPGPDSPPRRETSAVGDWLPDKPLDLSEWGRDRGRGTPKPTSTPTASPKPETPGQPGAQREDRPEQDGGPAPQEAPHPLWTSPPSQPSPGVPGEEARGRLRAPHCPQRPHAVPAEHGEGLKLRSEQQEPEPPGYEGSAEETSEASRHLSEDLGAGPAPKRKRISEAWAEASKKPALGRAPCEPRLASASSPSRQT